MSPYLSVKLINNTVHEKNSHLFPRLHPIFGRRTTRRKRAIKVATKYTEFQPLRSEYETILVKLSGYSDENSKNRLISADSCYVHGNTYATWVSNTKIQELENFASSEEAKEPKSVIGKADEYIKIYDMLAADPKFPDDCRDKSSCSQRQSQSRKSKNFC
jgi:hypothetical protein